MSAAKQAVEQYIRNQVAQDAYDIIVTAEREVSGGHTIVEVQYKAHAQTGYFTATLEVAESGEVHPVE